LEIRRSKRSHIYNWSSTLKKKKHTIESPHQEEPNKKSHSNWMKKIQVPHKSVMFGPFGDGFRTANAISPLFRSNLFLYLLFYFAVSLEVSLFLQDTIVIEYDHMTSMKPLRSS
jgi:hypothetical protein